MSQSEYDGHDNYAENARKEAAAGAFAGYVEDNPEVPTVAWKLLNGLHWVVGLGVGVAIAYRAGVSIKESVHGELGFGGIPILIGILLLGSIAAGVYISIGAVIVRFAPRWQTMAVMNLIAVLFIWFAMVQPIHRSNEAEAVVKQQALDRQQGEERF